MYLELSNYQIENSQLKEKIKLYQQEEEINNNNNNANSKNENINISKNAAAINDDKFEKITGIQNKNQDIYTRLTINLDIPKFSLKRVYAESS